MKQVVTCYNVIQIFCRKLPHINDFKQKSYKLKEKFQISFNISEYLTPTCWDTLYNLHHITTTQSESFANFLHSKFFTKNSDVKFAGDCEQEALSTVIVHWSAAQ